MWQYLFVVILAVLLFNFMEKRKKFARLAEAFKHNIRSLPFFGVSYLFLGTNETRLKALQFVGEEAVKSGGVIADWFGPMFYLVVADPEMASFLLKECLAKDDIMSILKQVVGNGIVVAPVPIWRPRRRVLVASFTTKHINAFVDVFVKQSMIMAERLREKAGTGPFAMWDFSAPASMDTICEAVLGVELNTQKNHNHPFIKTFAEVSNLMAERICQPWFHSDAVYNLLPRSRVLRRHINTLYKVVDEVIEKRRKVIKEIEDIKETEQPPKRGLKTFLEVLIEESNLEGEFYTDEQLREEILTIIIAGMDTSATGVGLACLMFAKHPDVQEKVFQEIKEVFGESTRPVSVDDLHRFKYLEAFIKETLRLYPVVPVILRKATQEVTIPSSGVKVPSECGILINIWAINRHPHYWGPDADLFKPERFLQPETQKHAAQFIAFSNGPRNCVGNRYAMMQMKTVLVTLIRQFRILPADPRDDKPLRFSFEVMLKDVNGFKICLESRRDVK